MRSDRNIITLKNKIIGFVIQYFLELFREFKIYNLFNYNSSQLLVVNNRRNSLNSAIQYILIRVNRKLMIHLAIIHRLLIKNVLNNNMPRQRNKIEKVK